MDNEQKQWTKNQHFVPKTYLYKFGSKGLLDRCYIRPFKCERQKSIKKYLCCEDWFYETLTYMDDKDMYVEIINFIENKLGKIETKYNNVYDRVIKAIETSELTKGRVMLSKNDIDFIKKFIALQAIRTKKAFDIVEQILRDSLLCIDLLDEKEFKMFKILSLFPASIHNNPIIKWSLYDEFLKQLYDENSIMVFLVTKGVNNKFFASDHPVVIVFDNDGYGFFLPINENVAILICNVKNTPVTKPFSVIAQNSKWVNRWNEVIVQNSNKYVMSLNFTNKELDFIKSIKIPE